MGKSSSKGGAVKKGKTTTSTGSQREDSVVPNIPQGLIFTSYREQLLGPPCPTQPHRRMRRWWLRDSDGNDHAAVETQKWDDETKRFEYSASEEFAKMAPMTCYSHKSVYEYLDLFLKPKQKENSDKGTESTRRKEKSPNHHEATIKKRKQPAVSEKDASKAEGEETNSKKKVNNSKGKEKVKKSGTKEGDEILRNVSKELAMLQAAYGVRYSLTIIGPHGDVKILSSPTVSRLDIDPMEVDKTAYPKGLNMLTDAVLGTSEQADAGAGDNALQQDTITEEKKAEIKSDNKKDERIDADDHAEVKTEKMEENTLTERLRLPGVQAVVEAIKDEDVKQYLSGTFWRRDPFPPMIIKDNLAELVLGRDCGQQKDEVILKDFLSFSSSSSQPSSEVALFINEHLIPIEEDDFHIQAVWGIDPFTRQVLDNALSSCESPISSREQRNVFFNKYLLPGLNMLSIDGWDIIRAFEIVIDNPNAPQNFRDASKAAIDVLNIVEETGGTGKDAKRYQPLRPSGRRFARSHPKGDGVILRKEDGIPAESFVGEYVGECLSSWRFFERDPLKSRLSTKSQSVINSCTCGIQRPDLDGKGYQIAYIDASQKGNFVSRINHSCQANCVLKKFIFNGQLRLGVWTKQPIEHGEELTIDYREKGDFERDLQGLSCLCGSEHCEGEFINLSSSTNPINGVFSEKNSIIWRTKLILDCSVDPAITRNDQARLERYGFKDLVLRDGVSEPDSNTIPEWLKSWISYTLKLVEEEGSELRVSAHTQDHKSGDEKAFSIEDVNRLVNTRIKALMISIEKLKMFLRNQTLDMRSKPPLKFLKDDDLIEFLWAGKNSVASRAIDALSSYLDSLKSSTGSKRSTRQGGGDQEKTPWWQVSDSKDQESPNDSEMKPRTESNTREFMPSDKLLASMQKIHKTERVRSVGAARKGLKKIAEVVALGAPLHAGLHDVLMLYACTENYFEQTEYKAFRPLLNDGSAGARYRTGFPWAILCSWFKSSGDPVDLLCTDRRGVLCLPDLESCYLPAFAHGEYMRNQEREALISFMESDTGIVWPRNLTSFTFKTSTRYFGSPQFDGKLREDGDKPQGLIELVKHLKNAF
eukprot:jgi/Picsp_1/1962/NSC_05428-R1_probable histone-lysine n-methyltransferase atxr3-like